MIRCAFKLEKGRCMEWATVTLPLPPGAPEIRLCPTHALKWARGMVEMIKAQLPKGAFPGVPNHTTDA